MPRESRHSPGTRSRPPDLRRTNERGKLVDRGPDRPHGITRCPGIEHDLVHDQLAACALEARVDASDDPIAVQHRHRPVAELAEMRWRVDLGGRRIIKKKIDTSAI